MKLVTREDMTPELIAASDTHTKAEKLEMLKKMRRDALEKREAGEIEGSEADARLHDVDRAIAQVTKEDDGARIALGRTTSA